MADIESYSLKVWRTKDWVEPGNPENIDKISTWELTATEHMRPAEPIVLASCTTIEDVDDEADVIARLLADAVAKGTDA